MLKRCLGTAVSEMLQTPDELHVAYIYIFWAQSIMMVIINSKRVTLEQKQKEVSESVGERDTHT